MNEAIEAGAVPAVDEARLSALCELAVALSDACSAEEVAARALAVVTAQCGCTGAWIAGSDPDERRLIQLGVIGSGAVAPAALTGPVASSLQVVSGGPLWLSDVEQVRGARPGLVESLPTVSAVVLVALPAAGDRRVPGEMGLHFDRPRPPAPGEAAFLTTVGILVGQALDRAELRGAEQAAAARAAAAAQRAEHLSALAAALAATVTVDDVATALEEHVQQAVACQVFSLRAVDPEARVARGIRLGGTPIGYQDRFADLPLDVPNSAAEVIATRAPVFLTSARENRGRYGAVAAERYEAARGEALARLPLLVEGELIAILSVAYWNPREFEAADRQFLTTVADLAAQALGRAMRTQRLHSEARRHRLSSAALAAINRRLDPTAQLNALARAVVPELADFSSVHVLREPVPPRVMPDLPVITDRIAARIIPGVPLPDHNRDLVWNGDGDPITSTILAGDLLRHPIPTPTVPEWGRTTGTAATFRDGLRQVVLAPVIVEGLVVAVASFGMCHDRAAWPDEELDLIEQIAGYAAIALEHGLSYQRSRDTALVLQRSLLSAPPTVDGLEIAARYEPAGRDEVGGDWYDAFEIAPGRLAIAVGDVVGHDITAAAAMGQLRAVLRALALDEDLDPGAVLDRMAEANRCLHITALATVLFARLTRTCDGWTLRWASAGHPPPLLVEPRHPGRPLTEALGLPLLRSLCVPHEHAQITLEQPGTLLLLYTDGMIERRGSDLDQNITELCTRTAALAGEPLDHLCDQLLAGADRSDDRALLALRINTPEAPRDGRASAT